MNDNGFEKLMKTVETGIEPPEGIKDKILSDVFTKDKGIYNTMSPIERFIYESPLRVACIFSLTISGMLWAVMGSRFNGILNGFLGIR
jgi:hypothetical protein